MRVLRSGIVWENPKPYLVTRHAMHPTPVNLGGGQILCAHDIGQAPESMDYETWVSRSMDGGCSWLLESKINGERTERPTTSFVRIARTAGGLVGLGARLYRDNPDEGLLNRRNLGYVPMDVILVRSADGGRTWSLPETVMTPLEGPAFEISHAVLELPDRTWLAPMATWRGWDGRLPNGEKALVLISRDRGRTFADYGVTFDGTAEGLIHWEQSVVSLGGNDVFSVAWVYHPESGSHRPNRYTVSHDGGRTFAPAREVGIQGQTCKVARLRDGRLLLAYRRVDKPGLWAQLATLRSDDTLVQGEALPLWGAGMASSGMEGAGNRSDELSALKFGFPQMVQMEDDTVLLVFWAFEDWGCRIRSILLDVR